MSVHEPTYPKATRELAELRNRLAPGPAAAFPGLQSKRVLRRRDSHGNEAVDRGSGRACDGVPALHPRPYRRGRCVTAQRRRKSPKSSPK